MKNVVAGCGLSVLLIMGAAASTPQLPNPRWRVQVLIYPALHIVYADGSGAHDVITQMTPDEIQRAVNASNRFFSVDVPALTSGQMTPLVTVTVKSTPLTKLSRPFNCGWWPDPLDVVPDLEASRYDSAVVIWKDDGWDSAQRRSVFLACYGGLTWPRGTGQTYASFILRMIPPDQRNVFKHEWGHSILFYYNDSGTAPKPPVNNHINNTDTRYVHCRSAQPYILIDETDGNPIPNSIYNNESGFTRDYYSGVTATADLPERCLGIGPAVWATGGPRTRPIADPGNLNGDSKVDVTDLMLLMQASEQRRNPTTGGIWTMTAG